MKLFAVVAVVVVCFCFGRAGGQSALELGVKLFVVVAVAVVAVVVVVAVAVVVVAVAVAVAVVAVVVVLSVFVLGGVGGQSASGWGGLSQPAHVVQVPLPLLRLPALPQPGVEGPRLLQFSVALQQQRLHVLWNHRSIRGSLRGSIDIMLLH